MRRLAPLVGLAAVVALLSAAFVAVQGPRVREDAVREWRLRLSSLAADRATAIDLWLSDGLEDVRLIASYPTVRYLAEGRTSGPLPFPVEVGPAAHLDEVLAEAAAAGGYVAAALLDASGAKVAHWSGGTPLDGACATAVLDASARAMAGVAACLDGRGEPLVLFVAPVDGTGLAAVVAAAARSWLFPFVAGDPSPASTSETVLVAEDGDAALFLAPLRFLPAAPLSVRQPLATEGCAARAALRGPPAVGRYVDYRGASVIAAVRRLELAAWGLAVKVDENEVLLPVRRELALEAATLAAALLAAGTGGLALRRHLRGRRLRERLADLEQREALRAALTASEQRLQAFFDAGAVGMLFGDVHGNILDANDELLRIIGSSREELAAGSVRWLDITPPEFLPLDEERIEEARRRGACTPYEKQYVRKDGSRVWVLVGYHLLGERREESVAFVVDISKQKEAEAHRETLRHERDRALARLELQVSSLPIGLIITEPDLTLVDVNPAAERIFGYARDELVGRDPFGLIIPESARPFMQGFLARLRAGNETLDAVNQNLTKDGRTITCQWHDTPLRDADGNLIGLMAMVQDVTDRERSEQALRASEALYHDLVETSQDLIWQCDADGRYTYLNPAWEGVLGYPVAEMLGRRFADFQRPEHAERDLSEFSRLLAGGSVKGFLTTHLARDGREVHLVFNAKTVLTADGRPAGTRGTAYDLSDRLRIQRALEEREELLAETGRTAKVGGWEFDAVTGQGTWTDEVARIHGLDPGDPTNRERGLGFYQGRSRELIEAAVRGAVERGESYDLELELVTDAGERKWVRTIGHPVREGGKVVKVRGSFQDITDRKRAETALAANEERFRQLFESMSDGVAVYRALDEGSDFVFTELNPAGERISAVSRVEVLGKRVSEAFPGIAEMGLLEVFRAVWRDGVPRRYPVAMYEDDRLGLWVENLVYRLPTGEIVAVYSDATERKRAEADLAESERALATLMSNLPGMAYRCANRPEWPMEFVSEGCTALTGYAPAELQAGGVVAYGDLILSEDRAAVWEEVQRAVVADRPFELEYRITTRDGALRWVWERGRAVRGRDGSARALEGFIADITERRAAEEALRRARDRAQRYLDLAGVMFVALDRDGLVTLVNPRACEVLGAAPDEIVGHDWFAEFIPGRERARVRRTFQRLVAGEIHPAEHFENTVLTRSGAPRLIAWHNALLRDDAGAIQGTLSSGEDVTERRAAAASLRELRLRLAEAEEAERRRLARELHDQVGQSLTALGINLSIVRQKIADVAGAGVEQRLDDSRSLVDEVVAQVRDVMAALRPSVLDDYGLGAALEWTAGRFQERTGIPCVVVAAAGDRRLAAPVETALFRIAQEALTNVARHAGACRVTVELEMAAGLARLVVRDDGAGFDPGAGVSGRMGLAGMRERAEGVGGRLDVRSAPGEGAVVVAEVPMEAE